MSMHPEWEQLALRLQGEAQHTLANSRGGCALLTMHVVVDAEGKPMFWLVADGKRIEPARNAKQILKALVGA